MARKFYDVVIIGGGIMGSSTAYYITKSEPKLSVAVVERDPSYVQASTTLSLSNVRIQFSLKENIQISQYTIQVLKRFEDEMVVDDQKPNISFRQVGNLFLVDESGKDAAQNALGLQRRLGCRVEWWSPKKIKEKYPLYEPVNFAGGTFGPDDGYFDAYAALMGYKAKAKSLGAEYINDEVAGIKTKAGRVTGISLAQNGNLNAKIVVNCAGAWATQVADTLFIRLPIIPIKRQVFVIDPAVKPEEPLPLTILPSGLYLRSETGGLILVGKSMDEDPVGYEFTWDDKRFIDILWPELTGFVPAFDRLKVVRGWAGLYAVNTFDGNAILGEWPELRGLYLANGFSGHGVQQAPAVGRYLSELILGSSFSLDLSIFGPERILENKPLSEEGLV
jgi:glycine/D-amino acid oxidase-like deaminating enzyme